MTDDFELEVAESRYEQDTSPPEESNTIKLTSLDEVEVKDARWLIEGVIPEGDITMLVGDGGVGKGFIWSNIAAAVSAGSKSIFDEAFDSDTNTEHRKVILFSSEDSLSVQIKRRLMAAGADLKNILSIDLSDPQFTDIQFDSDFVAAIVKQEKPALMIFDPIQSFIGRINVAARNEVRNALNPLISLGADNGTSFLIVVHTNKKLDAYGRNRMADSADLWDIARSVLIAGYTTEEDIRYLSQEKCNYAPLTDTVLYRIENDKVNLSGITDSKDIDFVKAMREQKHHKAEQLEKAMDNVMSMLSKGAKTVREIDTQCLAAGISKVTLQRAKRELNNSNMVKEWSQGAGDKHTWYMEAVKQR